MKRSFPSRVLSPTPTNNRQYLSITHLYLENNYGETMISNTLVHELWRISNLIQDHQVVISQHYQLKWEIFKNNASPLAIYGLLLANADQL